VGLKNCLEHVSDSKRGPPKEANERTNVICELEVRIAMLYENHSMPPSCLATQEYVQKIVPSISLACRQADPLSACVFVGERAGHRVEVAAVILRAVDGLRVTALAAGDGVARRGRVAVDLVSVHEPVRIAAAAVVGFTRGSREGGALQRTREFISFCSRCFQKVG
jgi:hypothetical protein